MKLENLTPEQREKAQACKTPEEILALAKSEGYELSDDELEQVSGGWGEEVYFVGCTTCGWHVELSESKYVPGTMKCPECGAEITML